MGATRVSCMIMFILAGAKFLSMTMGYTGIPRALAEWVAVLDLPPYGLIAVLCVAYIILGTALDGISMIVLTSAVVLPMIQKAGFDLIWFGIFIVLLVEIAEVTPPVGFNLFVLQNMTGRDSNTIAQDVAALLRAAHRLHRAHHRLPGDRDVAPRRGDGRRQVGSGRHKNGPPEATPSVGSFASTATATLTASHAGIGFRLS